MTTSRARWVGAAAATLLLVGYTTSALAQNSGGTFIATLSPLVPNSGTGTFNSILTLKNLGPTLYSPLTVSILRSPPGNGGSNSAATFSFISIVPLPNGSLLPNETQNLTITFPNPPKVGFTNTVTSVTGLAAPTGLGITVTGPIGGQTPAGPTFLVTGTLTSHGVAGASLDGLPACVTGSSFYLNAFQPQVSPTSFTATATDIDGGQRSVSVSISPALKGLRVTPLPSCGGIAPLTETFTISLDTTDSDTIVSKTIDFGAGAGPGTAGPGTSIQYVYANPGLYTVTATATTAQGATLTQSAIVSVLTPVQAFASILENTSLLQSALSAQNLPRALSYLTGTSQPRYAPVLTQSGINLPGLATLLSTAQPLVLLGDYAEVVVTVNGPNGPQSSSMVLVRDSSGLWRVDSW
jgi:hypothetical protein